MQFLVAVVALILLTSENCVPANLPARRLTLKPQPASVESTSMKTVKQEGDSPAAFDVFPRATTTIVGAINDILTAIGKPSTESEALRTNVQRIDDNVGDIKDDLKHWLRAVSGELSELPTQMNANKDEITAAIKKASDNEVAAIGKLNSTPNASALARIIALLARIARSIDSAA